MPTDENLTNTNPSSNNQTGSTQTNNNIASNNATSNNEEKLDFLDIDLNLDGIDVPDEKGEKEYSQENTNKEQLDALVIGGTGDTINTEDNSVVTESSWLDEENKKFEESIGQNNIIEEAKEQKEVSDLSNTQNLDLPFIGENNNLENNTNENIPEGVKLDDLSDLFEEEKRTENIPVVENQDSIIQNQIEQTNNEEVIENSNNYIPSDTGEEIQTNTGYVPNENSFAQVQNLLNSNQTGNIDLSTLELEQNTNSNSNQNVENNTNQNNGINLNEISSVSNNNEKINIEQIIQSSQFEPIVIEDKKEVKQENVNANVEKIPEGAKVISSAEFSSIKKKKGTGLKIFILILVLIVGGSMVLTKMYPEETKQIITAIKYGNNIDIDNGNEDELNSETEEEDEYIDNLSDIDGSNEESSTGDIMDEIEEEIDPDSLAGQLEIENVLEENVTDENIGGEHGSAETLDSIDSSNTGINDNSEEFNAFEGIDTIIDSEIDPNQEIIDELEEYAQLGESFNLWGRENNNSTAMKYGLFIKNHSERLLDGIANNEEIDMIKIADYISKFDNYIERLNTVTEGQVSNSNNLDTNTGLDYDQSTQTESQI